METTPVQSKDTIDSVIDQLVGPELFKREMFKIIKFLERTAVDAGYNYVIIGPDKKVIAGQLPTPEAPPVPEVKKRALKYGRGEMSKIYEPIIQEVKSGQLIELSCPDEFEIEDYRSSISAWCSNRWGRKQHNTVVNKTNKTVELYRH
jgi:hypothetical protein